ncbi:succinylglutamate desuccinylase/aspartoacylase family protein [Serratia aquatilis]|uniref:Succinylglutamate desuccinylase/aspartoacylase family protein n=1 Tax=Serratia aquatilis TaxID=1737515 RepID=A0ABV6EIU3_9GAMM
MVGQVSPLRFSTLSCPQQDASLPVPYVEVGGPRHFDKKLIQASVDGVMNILADYAMSNEKVGKVAKDTNFFFGNKLDTIVSKTGGYVEMLVDLGDQVKAGQKIAIQRNFFGKTTMEYFSNVNGMVSIIARDALREPGTELLSILSYEEGCKEQGCQYVGELE